MATTKAVWGIDIGQCSLKAVKLRPAEEGKLELVAFDVIEHPKILSQPDADPDELIRAAIEKFTSRNEYQGDAFVIGVPGHQTFARFCKLPPVEERKIPDIVRFEAGQQIPFDMNDVVWDYEVFKDDDMPDVEVGIFAIRKDIVRRHLDRFADFGITPVAIQTMPSALYNFCRFDKQGTVEEGAATVVIDVGAQHTDLVVVEPNSAWTRNIPLGGNAFTEALVKAFKLSFAKAESLKRTAATSKYARQIFQAMRPVFSDLVAEIQRSLGFYASTHRDTELKTVLACGNAFRLPGLQKYIENNLTITGGVTRLESFNQVITTSTSNAPQFSENVLSFASAYGLALQELGLAPISANLIPPELARVVMWKRKQPYFIAAAASLALAATFPMLRTSMDQSALAAGGDDISTARAVVNRAEQYQKDFRAASTDTGDQQEKIEKLLALQQDRALVPQIMALVHEALPPVDPRIASAETPADLKKAIESDPATLARTRRGEIRIESLNVTFQRDIEQFERPREEVSTGGFGSSRGRGTGMMFNAAASRGEEDERPNRGEPAGDPKEGGGFWVSMSGVLLYGESQSEAASFLETRLIPRLRELGQQPGMGFHIPLEDPKGPNGRNLPTPTPQAAFTGGGTAMAANPFGTPGARRGAPTPGAASDPEEVVMYPDPVTGEEMAKDWRFTLGFKVKFGDPPQPEQEQPAEGE